MQQSARYGLTWREAYDRASRWGEDSGLKLTYGKKAMEELYSGFQKNYSEKTNLISLESDITPLRDFQSVGRSWQAGEYRHIVLLDVHDEETGEWTRQTRAFDADDPRSLDKLTEEVEESKYQWGVAAEETVTGVALYRVYKRSDL
jgi:hypothetical protein